MQEESAPQLVGIWARLSMRRPLVWFYNQPHPGELLLVSVDSFSLLFCNAKPPEFGRDFWGREDPFLTLT